MFKNILAVVGGTVILVTVCRLYGQCVHGYYADQYNEKLDEYKRAHPSA